MAAIEVQPVIDAAQPWCCVPQGDLLLAVLAALIDVGNGNPVPDVDELMEQVACLKCAVQGGDVPLLILGAVANITGGGGGAQQVYTGAAPPAAPDNPALPALFYPTGGGTLLQWDGAAWV